MSTTETIDNKLESETERPTFRPQRPPPPPPTQSEPPSPIDIITMPPELEVPFSPAESFDLMHDVEDNQPSLLFVFTDLFDKFDFETVQHKILTRQMTTCPFTTVLWRIFLHCLPRDSCQWNQIIDTTREHYKELADTYLLDLKKIREHNGDLKDLNHPLSQEENSLWNQYYVYEELRENIDQDVRRTCQEIPFFRQKHILDLLLQVLYIHSRQYGQSLPYRQGMHEILAVIVYVIHMESLTVNEYPESNELMKKLYDPAYLAHDSFAIYEKIMEHLQQYYDFKPNKVSLHKNANISERTQTLFQRSSIIPMHINDTVMRVNSIFERLRDHNSQLYQKLEDLSIEPAIYGIRWLRLLFGREIPFDSIPSLWTVIFCHDEYFGFVDYFFLALLIKIGQLFDKHSVTEYSFCLQYLMQPNVISDVESIIHKALSLERTSRQHLSLSFDAQYNRTISKDLQKSTSSPGINYLHNPLIDSTRSNSPASFNSSSQYGKMTSCDASKENEMAVSPGKEMRQRLDESLQMQKSCARLIQQFIERLRKGIMNLHAPNEEEVLIQLTGLEQIASILQGSLTVDDNSLQVLLNYKTKEKSIEKNNNNNDIA